MTTLLKRASALLAIAIAALLTIEACTAMQDGDHCAAVVAAGMAACVGALWLAVNAITARCSS